MSAKILNVAKVPQVLLDALALDYTLVDYPSCTTEQLSAVADQIQVIVASGESVVNAEIIAKFTNLKLIAVFGVGYDGVDIQAAFASGIQVTNTPGVLTDDVADLGIGLMIATARQLIGAQKFIENGQWQSGAYPLATKVTGAKLGIVGLGRVGQAIAHRATAFNMDISYFDKVAITGYSYRYYDNIINLARDVDFLIICASAGPQTKHLINGDVLNALGKTGILINVARGAIIDQSALIKAIEEGLIGGAGLDVFAHEPNVPDELLRRNNLVVTPHIASATTATRRQMQQLVIDNIHCFFKGETLITPVIN